MSLLELDSVTCKRGERTAIDAVTLGFAPGEFVALCGLNGAGKSTLLEIVTGLLPPTSGQCRFDGRELRAWNMRALAQRVSFLPQSAAFHGGFTCGEVVRMGRYPFGGGWRLTETDIALCRDAMRLAECEEFEARPIQQLSGGERQRVLFAAALAQQPSVLILDEPGAFVDLPHQIHMFRALRDLCAKGLLCLAATHDLNLAAAFCSRAVLLDRGRVAADGTPAHVLGGAAFRAAFGQHVRVETAGPGSARVHYEI